MDLPLAQVTKVVLGQPGVSDDVRHRVFAALQDAGLVRLTEETTEGTLGVVVPGIVDNYVGEVVRGIQDAAKAQHYTLLFNVQYETQEDDLVQLLKPGGCDGVISVVPSNLERLIELCHLYEREYVLVERQDDSSAPDALNIEVNNHAGILAIMQHLFDLGHRRIAFITGALRLVSARERLQGYRDALGAAGIAYDTALVGEGDWGHPSGYAFAKRVLQRDPPPTAIVASNDQMAFGVIQAARQLDLEIPRDLSISGFDDIPMAATIIPALTTVRQPMYQIGQTAVDLLIKRLKGEPIAQTQVRLDTELVIRDSTGPARH
ncbi:MAG TPA: substrate-binding domain-containing protein [Phototrophicaceae bacterium]|nr:substrate-binding domain-containing protein [Phototrophicaceae bacterium]